MVAHPSVTPAPHHLEVRQQNVLSYFYTPTVTGTVTSYFVNSCQSGYNVQSSGAFWGCCSGNCDSARVTSCSNNILFGAQGTSSCSGATFTSCFYVFLFPYPGAVNPLTHIGCGTVGEAPESYYLDTTSPGFQSTTSTPTTTTPTTTPPTPTPTTPSPSPTPASSSSTPVGAIVGGVVGGVAVIALIALVVLLCMRRRSSKDQTPPVAENSHVYAKHGSGAPSYAPASVAPIYPHSSPQSHISQSPVEPGWQGTQYSHTPPVAPYSPDGHQYTQQYVQQYAAKTAPVSNSPPSMTHTPDGVYGQQQHQQHYELPATSQPMHAPSPQQSDGYDGR